MKGKPACFLSILIFIWSTPIFPDIIKLTDGSKVEGRILNADERYVNIRKNEGRKVQVLHNKIESIIFTWADMIYLESGETLKCKIVQRIENNLRVVASDGPRMVPFENIKMYYYHTAQHLEIPELPETGPEFKNEKPFLPNNLAHEIFIGIHGGVHWPSLSNWKKDFLGVVFQYSGGIKAGFYLNGNISIGAGITLDFYDYTHYEDLDSHIKTLFYYGGIEYAIQIGKKSGAYAFIGVNTGLFQTTGTCYLYSFREIALKSINMAFMPRIGARAFLNRNLSVGIEAGYLLGKSGSIATGLVNDLTIKFNGFSTFLNILGYF